MLFVHIWQCQLIIYDMGTGRTQKASLPLSLWSEEEERWCEQRKSRRSTMESLIVANVVVIVCLR